jgi:DNA-binding protein HU-beta
MNKAELINNIASKTELTKTASEKALSAFIEIVTETVTAKEDVVISGFGKFTARDRNPRAGRNPGTGEAVQIPASTVPVFKAGKYFKEAVSNG